jgi:hypothetical protein
VRSGVKWVQQRDSGSGGVNTVQRVALFCCLGGGALCGGATDGTLFVALQPRIHALNVEKVETGQGADRTAHLVILHADGAALVRGGGGGGRAREAVELRRVQARRRRFKRICRMRQNARQEARFERLVQPSCMERRFVGRE